MGSRSSTDIYAETLAVFDRNEHRYEPLTTPEVANALDVKRRTVYKRLRTLVDRGELETKETGSNSRVWWRSPHDTDCSSPDVEAEGAADSGRYPSGGGTSDGTESSDGEVPAPERELQANQDYREIFELIPDGVTLHDPSTGELLGVNQQYCEMLGYPRDELLSEGFEVVHADVAPYTSERAARHLQRAATEGPQTFEWLDRTRDGEPLPVEVHLRRTTIGDEDRVLAVVRDISDRKERERELSRRSRAMESAIDGMAIVDGDGQYRYVNESHVDVYGYEEPGDFVGEHWEMCYTEDELARFEDDIIPTLDEERAWRGETYGVREDGSTFPQELSLTLLDDGGIVCVVRDITDRKEREREVRETAQQLQGVLDTVEAAIFLKDAEGQYLLMNQNCRELVGLGADEEIDGLTDDDLFPEDVASRFLADDQRAFEADEALEREERVPTPDGTSTVLTRKSAISDETGDPYAICAVSTDITDRKERERELRAARQFNEELVENAPFGMFRLDEDLRISYENPRAEEIIGLPDDEESSAAIGVDIRELPSVAETGQADQFSRLRHGETIEFEFPFESIYGKEAYFTGRGVPLYRDGEFDGALLMVTDISERRERERELERRREQLAALDELNSVVRGITDAVIDQSTREEIERVVCDRLAASDSYRFAWIGAVDSEMQLEPRAEAGVDGYLEEISLSTDPSDPAGRGPIARAVRTQDIQVTQNAFDDPDFEQREQQAREYEFRSSVTIPIVHSGTLYGLLGVYSERSDAFATEERDVVGQLGEVIGHAMAAVDRKRALMSDEVVELKIRIPDLLESRGVSTATDGTITIDRTIPVGEDEYLRYGRATADAEEVLRAMDEQLRDCKTVRTFDETDGAVRFEQRLSDPTVTSVVADCGGHFAAGRIEDGTYSATIHLPPGSDSRRVVAGIRGTYPDAETISHRQVTREEPSPRQILGAITEKLTDRQRAALEAGYFGGFFEWPRDSSGEEVAESLDIGASTFHQHVRKAEKKLLDVVFTGIREDAL